MSEPVAVSLRDHFEVRVNGLERMLKERDRRMQERYSGQQLALKTALKNLAEYKANSNEWRMALSDARSEKISRTEFQDKQDVILEKIESAARQTDRNMGRIDELERLSKARVSALTIWFMGLGVLVSLVFGIAQMIHSFH